MKRLSLYLLFIFILHDLSSCAQTSKFIKSAKGYRAERIPGNIPVDDEGKPLPVFRDTLLFIYVATNKEDIRWTDVVFNGKIYSVTPLPVTEPEVMVGRNEENKEIRIPQTKGALLWKLELSPMEETAGKNVKEPGMILNGSVNGKGFRYHIPNPVLIRLPDSY